MTQSISTHRTDLDPTIASQLDNCATLQFVDQVRKEWEQSLTPDLSALLRENPRLCSQRSAVIELAVAEFRIRRQQGLGSDIQDYCSGFLKYGQPLYSSVFRQIEVEKYFDDHPNLQCGGESTAWPPIGGKIGSCQIVEELGRGALARVYLCLQRDLGDRQVVVKVSCSGIQEGKTLGKLQHSNIMPVHAIEVQNNEGLSYLCTPFLGRSTLHDVIVVAFAKGQPQSASEICKGAQIRVVPTDRLARGPEPNPRRMKSSFVDGIVYLAARLADALAYAHSVGVIHGDIKPSNILLTPEGEPVLLDFNLARDNALSATIRGGTIPYMAPETLVQLQRCDDFNFLHSDELSEVFSLGVVLFEALTGCVPYEVNSPSSLAEYGEMQLIQQKQGPPSLKDKNPQVGSSLAAIIQRCMAFQPENRFTSMSELQQALQKELSLTKRSVRWMQYHPRKTLAAAIAYAFLFVGVGLWLFIRPASHVRSYQAGLDYYAVGDFNRALSSFADASSDQPGYLDAHYAAARTNLELGRIDKALSQFVMLAKSFKHTPSIACAGYCFNLIKDHSKAIPWYRRAIDAGFVSGGMHNNLAVSYELGRSTASARERMELTESHMATAIRLLPTSSTVRFNIAICELKRFEHEPRYVPQKGLDQVTLLLNEGIKRHDVYVLTLRLYGAVGQTDSAVISEGIDLLADKCDDCGGLDISLFENDQVLRPFLSNPMFPVLQEAAKQVTSVPTERTTRFIDPSPWPSR